MADNSGYSGSFDSTKGVGDFNAYAQLAKKLINQICTMQLVEVVAVHSPGGISPAGTVDVQILVNQIDGAGVAEPHGIIYGLLYNRIQGGASAIIIDPAVGDIGRATFASHDISSVKKNRARSNPGSRRRFSYSDGIYDGGVLNATPSQYIQFRPGGITVSSPTSLTLTAAGHTIVISSAGIVLDGINWQHGHPYLAGSTPAETGTPE